VVPPVISAIFPFNLLMLYFPFVTEGYGGLNCFFYSNTCEMSVRTVIWLAFN
jgi:hypothetical protein